MKPLNFGRLLRRKPKVLTQVKVAEISAVDHAAAPGAKIMMRKRSTDRVLKAKFDDAARRLAFSVKSILDDTSVIDKNAWLSKSFVQCLDYLNGLTGARTSLNAAVKLQQVFAEPSRKNLDVSVGEARPDEGLENPDAVDEDEENADGSHHAGGGGENGGGAATKGKTMQTRNEKMRKLADVSPIELCKRISAANDAYDLSEAQIHSVVQCVAKSYARPGESEGSAFLRLLSGTDEISRACNTALMVAKHTGWAGRAVAMSKAAGMPGRATLEPRTTRGWDGQAVDDPRAAVDAARSLIDAQRSAHKPLSESGAWRDVAVNPKQSATEKLNALRDELARNTGLSPDRAYAQVYAARPDLAAQERLENRPSAAW